MSLRQRACNDEFSVCYNWEVVDMMENKPRKGHKWLLLLAIVFVAGPCYAYNSFALTGTTLTLLYPYFKADFPAQMVSHFPEQIPESATKVRFWYFPGALQGSTMMQLRYKLPNQEFTAALEELLERPSLSLKEGEAGTSYPRGMFRNERNTGRDMLPADFRVLTLSSSSDGEQSGIAISEDRHEIIYWLYWD